MSSPSSPLSLAAPRCRHIKVNGTRCGSPSLRDKDFCFYHHRDRPLPVECYFEGEYPTGEIALPYLEDAHSIQSVIRQVVQMVLQKRIERKTASLLLYAMQVASSNLKRVELEKPQPEQVVTNIEMDWQVAIAPPDQPTPQTSLNAQPERNGAPAKSGQNRNEEKIEAKNEARNNEAKNEERNEAKNELKNEDQNTEAENNEEKNTEDKNTADNHPDNRNGRSDDNLPPGTIHACYRPGPLHRERDESPAKVNDAAAKRNSGFAPPDDKVWAALIP
jgi:hypothetical protein